MCEISGQNDNFTNPCRQIMPNYKTITCENGNKSHKFIYPMLQGLFMSKIKPRYVTKKDFQLVTGEL